MKRYLTKIIVAVVALLIVAGSYVVWQKNHSTSTSDSNEPVACTLDAKICPDGSAVGRVGPNCEFSVCPSSDNSDVDVWVLSTDVGQGVSFEYPKTIALPFLSVVNWPPEIEIHDSPFVCTEVGNETTRPAVTTLETISERKYCVTKESEGAAGSVYVSYTYAFPFQNKTATFAFTLRYPQCANYDEPDATECRSQQGELKPLNFIDRMAATLKIN